ncbi:hypothetical protein [uncultured Lacinutrix sp.]|uniref:hypothetical protein n=1 Tax=uncultured Lacinutrix sp. TaxID=574032 RepID=UPI00260F26F0|nr:hypothetical protein [uncultured Lacinutrix sp.]
MTFDLKKFTKELQSEFKDSLTFDEIESLLETKEAYNKDTPLSTGKNLSLTYIAVEGEKHTTETQDYSGNKIDFKQKIETGVNIWIADNLKGKSSVLKILKYALTGKNSLKPNIKKWIKHIIVNFKIGTKHYTVYLNSEGRLKAYLLNGEFQNTSDIEKNKDEFIIQAKSESEYQDKIQDFFFKQFSYYSLKWTQKSSSKDSNELLEASASWNTYFKSIFLESKDSASLIFGGQEKKVFEMLMGLELTYPINRLGLKKDMLNDQKGKQSLFSKMDIKQKSIDKQKLEAELKVLNNQLQSIRDEKPTNINKLYSSYNNTLKEITQENKKSLEIENNNLTLRKSLNSINSKRSADDLELKRIIKEIEKNNKRIIDIQEYIDIGMFFSNLDIKHCPSCNHSVSENKKRIEIEEHKCALCNEGVEDSNSEIDKEIYNEKIDRLNILNLKLIEESQILNKNINTFNEKHLEYSNKIKNLETKKTEIKNTNQLNQKLKEIEKLINVEKEKIKPDNLKKEKIITDKAIIEYKITEIDKSVKKPEAIISFDKQIELLEVAISKLSSMRYKFGESILKRLSEIMLSEINEFGLKSITEIKISEKFEIQYKQDGDFITFNNIAEGEQLRAKIAFYLSLIQLDIEKNFGRHTRFLIIDSPGKEEADANFLKGLSSVLTSIEERYGEELQILIGTAERGLKDVVKNQYITPKEQFVF